MSLWGKLDTAAIAGSITATEDTLDISGANTAFTDEVEVGNVLTVGTDKYVVTSITDDETATITPAATSTETDTSPEVTQSPKYLSVEQATSEVSLVTTSEAQNTLNRADGIKTPGWTLYKEYGTGRKRVETLVAMKT